MPFQDFKDRQTAQQWTNTTAEANPTRPEQLDMLLTILADTYQPGATILDLGFGSGLVEEMIFQRIPGAQVVGVDASPAMMALAAERLQPNAAQYAAVEYDFSNLGSLQLPQRDYQFVISIQALHHLTADQMQAANDFIYRTLAPGGLFLLLDRIAVDRPALFDVYQSVWRRLAREYDAQVSAAEGDSFDEHVRLVRERGDLPLGLEHHLRLMQDAGFSAAIIHAHGNRALFAARKPG
jgi:tRNA (cmo5U34)-methyltransferase